MYSFYDHEIKENIDEKLSGSCLDITESSMLLKASFPGDFGGMEAYHINISSRIKIAFETITAERDMEVLHPAPLPSNILGTFFLGGTYIDDFTDRKARTAKQEADVHWSHTPGDTYRSLVGAGKTSATAFIIINPEIFDGLSTGAAESNRECKLITGKEEGVSGGGRLSTSDYRCLMDIYNFKPESAWDLLYIESRVLDLIGNNIERYRDGHDSINVPSLPAYETEALEKARELLADNLISPPSLSGLARTVGLNEFKLKTGFRKLYGETAFGYLRRLRLERAYDYLSAGELNVSETAAMVGYGNAAAFTAAFKKNFGISPVECRRRFY